MRPSAVAFSNGGTVLPGGNPDVDQWGIGGPAYRHPTFTGAPVAAKPATTKAFGPSMSDIADDGGRVDRWMAWKGTKSLRTRLEAQTRRAAKRGSRGTTVPLADLSALLAMVAVGTEPK